MRYKAFFVLLWLRQIELLQIDAEELSNEITHSAKEVSHYNVYIFYCRGKMC